MFKFTENQTVPIILKPYCSHRLQHRHPDLDDALQGRLGGVRRSLPRARERRLVALPQHHSRLGGDAAVHVRHQLRHHAGAHAGCAVLMKE